MSDLGSLIKATRDSTLCLSDLVSVYRRAVNHADIKVRQVAVDSLLLRASIAHTDEWQEFQERLQSGDEYIRCVALLGRLVFPRMGPKKLPDDLRQDERRRLVLQLIENHPEARVHQRAAARLDEPGDESAYDVASSLWLKKVVESPEDVHVLSNAAHFFAHREPLLSRGFLLSCQKLQPDVEEWRRRLAKLRIPGD